MQRIEQGLAFVTENRREEGLMMEQAISENLALASIRKFGARLTGIIERCACRGRRKA
ncbi:MAG: hypothetical protein HC779_01325 [Phyllobacteriaceae bacterium]|nr:hypothetical protein [Phyllobacteriaceae bacterium]